MWPRIAIVVGPVAGVAVASLVLGGLLLLGPAPVFVATPTAAPTVAPSLSPSPTPSARPTPTAIPSPSPTPAPSRSPSPAGGSPSPAAATLVHLGPDSMASSLQTILPGVTVTP